MKPGEFTAESKGLMAQRCRGECEVQWPNVCMGGLHDGLQAHHRRARGMGGTRRASTSRVSNSLMACRACHSYLETGERKQARDNGFLVSQSAEPAQVPVFYRHEFWALLGDDGSVIREVAA
ncbi:hypothetical protein BKG82_22995 [Mycobacteroides chelonae]|uniref:HNH domain-containing protein n=1 Tax=Mycobacteroides chelonae TaxID=1774 RepID=A0A1S1LFB2_MYCCH|nr:hypothetical protein BKG82_22995 [Mycobacteroides chelonae]